MKTIVANIILSSLIVCILPWMTVAKEITIKPNDNIQKMVDKAKDGDSIRITAGTYLFNQTIVIKDKKNLVIMGEEGVHLFQQELYEDVIRIENSENIIVRSLHAKHQKDSAEEVCKGSVISINNSDKITIESCELDGSGMIGVSAYTCKTITVLNCFIHHNSYAALSFYQVDEINITGCTIQDNANTLSAGEIKNITMLNNTISNNHPIQHDAEVEGD